MIIYKSENRVKRSAKLMQKILRELDVDLKYTACLNLSVQILGFENYSHFCRRDLDAPLCPLDEELSDAAYLLRDEFQMGVLGAAGLGAVARELLDRVNPTGSWSRKPKEESVWEAIAGNDPL
jgi:hypothetical protein